MQGRRAVGNRSRYMNCSLRALSCWIISYPGFHCAATLRSASSNSMEILKTAECFPLKPEESIFTIVILSENDQTYIARFNGRCASKTVITREELEDVVKLDKTAFQPQYLNTFTRAEPTSELYVKCPNLLSYYPIDDMNQNRIAEEVLREVQVCEHFRLHPHPNIAEYIGCEVTDGRISGICFKQYTQSLQQRLNPGHLNKREFARSSHLDAELRNSIIEGIKNGLDHIHALGFVHNDITPSNIMLDEHETPIIIDFGSCRAKGVSLEDVGRTYEWYDDEVQTASPSNDLHALAEMEAWMFGKVDDFKFAEMTV
jgi:serine/threonine protein kinase